MMRRPKVVHLVEAYGGGVLDIVNMVANGLAAGSEQVIVYAPRPQTPPFPQRLLADGVRLVRAPLRSGIRPLADLRSLLWLLRFLRAERADVLHLHSSKAGALGRVLSPALPSLRVFYTPHQFAFLDSSVPRVVRALYLALEWLLVRIGSSVTVLACSHSEYEFARRLGARAAVVENATELARPAQLDALLQARVARLRDGGPLLVLTAGRLVGQKNPQLFDAAAAEAARRGHRWRFLWVGDGPLPLTRAEKTGWLAGSEVQRLLAEEADVYVSTARSEGLSVAALQAQLLGVPCVLTDVPGNRDAAGGMPACRTVPARAQAMVDAIEQTAALADAHALASLQRKAEQRYAPGRMLRQLAHHYGVAAPI